MSTTNLRKVELASLFRSWAISIFRRAQLTLDYSESIALSRVVMFVFSFKEIWRHYIKISEILVLWRHLAAEIGISISWSSDIRSLIENKYHHSTQRDRLPLSWPISEWSKVKWAGIGALRKMLIAHERNKLARSTLCRFVENILSYLLHTLNIEVTTEPMRYTTWKSDVFKAQYMNR